MNANNQFNRAFMKRNARENLRGKYGAALVAVLLAQISSALFGGIARLLSNPIISTVPANITPNRFNTNFDLYDKLRAVLGDWIETFMANRLLLFALIFLAIVLGSMYSLFIGNMIQIGLKRWFLRASNRFYPAPSMEPLFLSFKRGRYMATFKAASWKWMWLFVWSIPFILCNILVFTPIVLLIDAYRTTGASNISPELIDRVLNAYGLPRFFYSPGFFAVVGVVMIVFMIILQFKRYQYKMTDYILADNPHIGTRRALTLSKLMSKGLLWRFFVLDLSFAGWFILASMFICLPGISVIFVMPYYEATWVEAYKNRRDYLVACQELTMEELGYVRMWSGS